MPQTLAGKLPCGGGAASGADTAVAVVGRNSLTAPAPFAEIYAVAELSEADTAGDPVRTAALLRQIGADIGRRHAVSTEPVVRSG